MENIEETEETTTTLESTLYLPDMENTTLAMARKRAIQWGPNTDEYLVECPGIEKYYGDSTLLVDFTDGSCQLFMGGELENFPLQASKSPFPLTLLAKILKSDAKQCISTSDIPGTGLSTIITEPMTWDQVGCRTEIFTKLVGMYAANQISLQHAQLLPKDISYREISRYETKSRRIETRMDELLAVFTHDNYLREAESTPFPRLFQSTKKSPVKFRQKNTPVRHRWKPRRLQRLHSMTRVNHSRPRRTSWNQQRPPRLTARVATPPRCHQPPEGT